MNHTEKVASAKTLALLGGGLGGLVGSRSEENAGRNALILGLMGAGGGAGAGLLGKLGLKGGAKGGDALAELMARGGVKGGLKRGEESTRELAMKMLKGKIPKGVTNAAWRGGARPSAPEGIDKLRQILAGAGMLGSQGGGRALGLAGGAGAGLVGGGAAGGMAGGLINEATKPDEQNLLEELIDGKAPNEMGDLSDEATQKLMREMQG